MKKKFNVGHFPIGTIAEFHVNTYNSVPFIGTVDEVVSNGPNSWVIRFSDIDSKLVPGEKESINMSWCIKIISRGTGGMSIKPRYGTGTSLSELTKFNYLDSKHPSQYLSFEYRSLLLAIAERYLNHTMLLDMDKLCTMLINQGVLRINRLHYLSYIQVNKKKLNKAIKQVINKCLLKRAKAQFEENKQHWENYVKDCEDGLWD